MRSCLDRVSERDNEVKAWAHLDPEQAIESAVMRMKEVIKARWREFLLQ